MASTESGSSRVDAPPRGDAERADRRSIECPIERKVEFLARADAYPEETRDVEVVETHLSWVFLTECRAYKLKKPVHLRRNGLDLRRLARRRRNCEDEVRLNRRFSEDVYLGTATLTLDHEGALHLDGPGEVVDWLVVMRRLPAHCMLDRALADGTVEEEAVRDAVRSVASVLLVSDPPALGPAAYRVGLARGVERDRWALCVSDPTGGALPLNEVERLAAEQQRLLRCSPELFDARLAQGRVVEGHGDLRPEHVCLDPPAAIDCLEFDLGLRTLDTADEFSFLALECERLGARDTGRLVLDEYAQVAGDRPSRDLLRFYRRYRALRRAKIAVWHLDDPEVKDRDRWIARARRYVELVSAPSPLEQIDQ